jgi:hypothetical protein
LFLGLKHATDADHVVAVTTFSDIQIFAPRNKPKTQLNMPAVN